MCIILFIFDSPLYMSLTIHFMTRNFKIHRYLLSGTVMEDGHHTSKDIKNVITESFQEWQIPDSKVGGMIPFSITFILNYSHLLGSIYA